MKFNSSDFCLQNIPLLVEKLKGNVVAVTKMDNFNHVDFVYGRQVFQVQNITYNVLKKYLMN